MLRPVVPVLAIALSTVAATTALAQSATATSAASWRVAFDASGASDTAVAFVVMPPGWHVTHREAGPAGIVYDAANLTSADFRVESTLYLFSSDSGAGAGLLFGGRDLESATPRYVTFVVGPDKRFRITRHAEGRAEMLVPWTAHASIVPHPGGRANVKQTLAVVADGGAVRFEVNGAVVATLPRADVEPAGIVGLRVEPRANVHVATLAIDGRNVAPVPATAP